MDRDAEIETIKHQLEMLRERQALYRRWGRVLRIFFMIGMPLFAIVVAGLLIKLSMSDPFMGGFVTVLAALAALLLWITRDRKPKTPGLWQNRWTDLASLPPSRFGSAFSTIPVRLGLIGRAGRPEAQAIEEQIAAREQRLGELGVPS